MPQEPIFETLHENEPMNNRSIRMFDMFCGGGGSSRGAVLAGVTPVATLDMWKLATDTYQLNFSDATIYQIKAGSLSPARILREVGEIDLLGNNWEDYPEF